MLKQKITRENMIYHLMSTQLDIVGKTVLEATMSPHWRREWSMSTEDFENFESYAIPLIKKVYKCNKKKAKNTFDWFQQNYGLTILP